MLIQEEIKIDSISDQDRLEIGARSAQDRFDGSGHVSDCEPDDNSDSQGAGNNEELEDEPRFVKID